MEGRRGDEVEREGVGREREGGSGRKGEEGLMGGRRESPVGGSRSDKNEEVRFR